MGTRRSASTAPKKKPQAKRPKRRVPSLAKRLAALGATIPPEELKRLPADGAENLDHYIYGSPKRY
jgi:hypothetical protein